MTAPRPPHQPLYGQPTTQQHPSYEEDTNTAQIRQPRRPRRWPWIVAGVLALLVIIGIVNQPGTPPPAVAGATPSPVPAATPTAEEAFLADIYDTPGLTSTMPDSDVIGIGRSVCDAIGTPGIEREAMIATLGTSKLGPDVMRVIVAAAEANLCPGKQYAPVAAPAPPPEPAGPATTLTNGTYLVGTDVELGTYVSPGPEAGVVQLCYVDVQDDSGNFLEQEVSREGQVRIRLREAGTEVKVSGCQPFTRQG